MKIWITSSALAGSSDGMLWSGALFGLTYLQQFDHQCGFAGEELSDQLQKLLQNEQINAASFRPSEADLTIGAKDDTLIWGDETDDRKTFNDWIALSRALCFPQRTVIHQRKTAETNINIELNLDGSGQNDIQTGLSFFDHMLEQIAKHGLMDVSLRCDGDLAVDEHHTIEDVAIALGEAITKALSNKTGITRYGFALPMDESACTVLLDLSGRPFLAFDGNFSRDMVGDFPTEMVEHFFYSLAMSLKATLHISVDGKNDHHKIEACFKSFAHCLRGALSRNERNLNILPSTKDLL